MICFLQCSTEFGRYHGNTERKSRLTLSRLDAGLGFFTKESWPTYASCKPSTFAGSSLLPSGGKRTTVSPTIEELRQSRSPPTTSPPLLRNRRKAFSLRKPHERNLQLIVRNDDGLHFTAVDVFFIRVLDFHLAADVQFQ